MDGLFLGVDGGATKTVALLADASGTVLGAGRAGSSDIHSESAPGSAVANVLSAVRDALAAADVSPIAQTSCVFGLCGADWPEDVEYYARELQAQLPLPSRPTVTNDAFNTLRAGTDDGVGVALVMGTGGAIGARGPTGTTWFSGERMERTGAIEFGREVLDLIMRGEYGSGPRPGFERAAFERFGVDSVEELVHTITGSMGTGYRSVARLAPVLLQAGHEGEPEARRIVSEHGGRIVGYVLRAAARVGLDRSTMTVVLAGGVFRHHGTDLRAAIARGLDGATIVDAGLEPVHGAVLMAADGQGVALDTGRLVASGPDHRFFDTALAV